MTEYVPADAVRRLAISAESDAGLFDDDSQANRLGEKIASDIRETLEDKRVTESEVCDA
jgi:hypothetical protein